MSLLRRLARRFGRGSGAPADLMSNFTGPLLRIGPPRSFEGFVFVAGLHRSGTTLVEDLLRAVCDIAVLRAPVPENEGQHLQDVFPAAALHGGPGRFAFAPEMHPVPPDAEAAARARDRLLACWSPWVAGEGRLLLEKSPPNLIRIPWLRAVFPGARFVVVTRDPRAVAAATRKWSRTSHQELIYHWHVAHAAAEAALGADCRVLRYEDLCDDPEGCIAATVSALDLPRRAVPLTLDPRFARMENSNPGYIAAVPPTVCGPGSWERFGYDLGLPAQLATSARHAMTGAVTETRR